MKRPRMCVPVAMAMGMATGGSSWSSLPGDILEQISHRLSTDADHLHIHQVCAHWRASTSPPTAFRPWVVARRIGSPAPAPGRYSFWQLPRRCLQHQVEIRDPPAGLPSCVGVSRGWLALADRARSPTRLVLWDPASGSELRLPPLGDLLQVFLSGDPLASPPSDWVAVATRLYGDQGAQQAFFWRPGDAAWSALSERATAGIETVAFHAGRVYYMDWRRLLVVCDISLAPPAPPRVWLMNIGGQMFRRCSCQHYHGVRGAKMVACAGQLLLVILRVAGGHPSFAEVYKTEWTPENKLELRDRVTDLGDHSLFLGRCESFALSAREYPATKRNHIYGLALQANHGDGTLTEWAFVYDLSSDTLKEIHHPEELREDGTKIWQPLYWLCLRNSYKKNQQQQTLQLVPSCS